MAQRNLDIIIKAKDLYTQTLNNVEGRMQSFKKNWVAVTATVVAAGYAVQKAFALAEEAAKFQQTEQAFANLAASYGVSSRQIINELQRASAQTISSANLMESAGKAMLLGIPADKLKEMMEIARASSRITGDSVQKAFDDIATGMGRQSKLILDNLGIVVDVEKANKAYADTMNIVGRELTDAEKKQAFHNATMEAGREIVARVNVQTMTAAEGFAKFNATMANFKIILGNGLVAISSFVTYGLMALSTAVASSLSFMANMLAKIISIGERLPWVGDKFKAAGDTLKGFAEFERGVADEAWRMAQSALEVGKSMFSTVEPVKGVTRAVTEQTTAVTAQTDALKKLGDEEDKEYERLQRKFSSLMERARMENKHLGEQETIVQRRQQLLGVELADTEASNELMNRSDQARSNIVGQSYRAIEDQMLSLIETGKFSLSAMGQVIAGQVKLELVGIAARAGVWALFELAAGLASAAWGNAPAASLHFAAAKGYGSVAGVALAGAAGVHALFGGTTTRPTAGTTGGEPLKTESAAPLPMNSQPESRSSQNITLIIQNPLNGQIADSAAESIIDLINKGGDMNYRINAKVIQAT